MDKRDEEFARVVATHRRALLRYGLRRLEDYAAAEDLLAETFLVAWRRFDERPIEAEELFWLYGIAGRVLYNVQRSQRRSLRLETRLAFERETERDNPHYSKENIEDLMSALGALSQEDAEIIHSLPVGARAERLITGRILGRFLRRMLSIRCSHHEKFLRIKSQAFLH